MARFEFRVDALPSDVFELTTSFLTGFDLLRLSHVTQRLLTELLARDAPEWQRRVAAPISGDVLIKSAKERYCISQSVRFPGRDYVRTVSSKRGKRGGAIDLWGHGMPAYWRRGSFSFDMWFALFPVDDTDASKTHFGGIILGAQSCAWSHNRWPYYHQQFVHVDTQGGLYCSVIDTKTAVASNLQPDRWYHLALTFERTLHMQCVYLNGELVHKATGELHSESRALDYGQLGSGCISGGALGKPAQDFCGWYGFYGVLDGCRLWRGVLQADDVRRAALGEQLLGGSEDVPSLMWSMADDGGTPRGDAYSVRCTRPAERVCAEFQRVPDRTMPAIFTAHHPVGTHNTSATNKVNASKRRRKW